MNWYKTALKKEPIKKPYRIAIIKFGQEQQILKELKDVRIYAFSSEQARMFFLKRYPVLRDYHQMGYEIEVRLDAELFKKRQEEKEREEKEIQEMWWNK